MIRTYTRMLAVALMTTALFSCSKEMSVAPNAPGNNNSGNPATGGISGGVTGTYDFLWEEVNTKTSMTLNEEGSTYLTKSNCDYVTKKNTGIVTFQNGKTTSVDFSYTVETMMTAETWIDSVKAGEQIVPFNFTLPAMSTEGTYTMVGTDSLRSGFGQVTSGIPDMNTTSVPTTFKISWAGDTLRLNGVLSVKGRQKVIMGSTYIQDVDAKVVMVLKKRK
ncbi:hypothetical protein [Chitinophaga vietnamensis]|uniref:hypothetical protein n=1 Tax=Chitinophaga vietnamensis TaxID=2593957 RepID=UPI001178479A|nr:hypothetical protein [Chitinophaga vietnamensis]